MRLPAVSLLQFSSMLFVPGMAPFDQDRQMGKSRNIRLYVKRVFISGRLCFAVLHIELGIAPWAAR